MAYTLNGTQVLYEKCDILSRKQIDFAISRAVRRKMLREGFVVKFSHALAMKGSAVITWRYVRYDSDKCEHSVAFTAVQCGGGAFHLTCEGNAAEYAIKRINATIDEKRAQSKRKRAALQRSTNRKQQLKHQKLKERQALRGEAPKQEKRRRFPSPAPMSLKRSEKISLAVVYRKSHILRCEALCLTAYVFDLRERRKHGITVSPISIIGWEFEKTLSQRAAVL